MTPLLANGINVPYVLLLGALVLIPLMAFEVFVESAILRRSWKLSWNDLFRFTLRANIWSLLAGIPVKFLNAVLYESKLPKDLPAFFEAYPLWISLGAGIYFVVTVAVETLYSWRSNAVREARLGVVKRAAGIFLANVASYSVLAPLHYHITKPDVPRAELRRDTKWTKHPTETLIYINSINSHLQAVNLDGSNLHTLVPHPVRDFQFSESLDLCLYRSPDGNLYLYKSKTGENTKVLETKDRYWMKDTAFSPSGELVAFMPNEKELILIEPRRDRRSAISISEVGSFPLLAWSTEEKMFHILTSRDTRTFHLNEALQMEEVSHSGTNVALLPIFGRVSGGIWGSTDDWGATFGHDVCGDLKVLRFPGLGAELVVYLDRETVFRFRVKSGLLGFSVFNIDDVAFLQGCSELVFESKDHLYLLDLETKRIGTIANGNRFVLLSDRYSKLRSQ